MYVFFFFIKHWFRELRTVYELPLQMRADGKTVVAYHCNESVAVAYSEAKTDIIANRACAIV